MKLNGFLLLVLLFSTNIYSQEQKITVDISLKETTLRTTAKSVPVRVKITNMSDAALDTAEFASITFYFSKCPQAKKCETRTDVYVAGREFKGESLKKYQSLEFEVNLADLYWNDLISSIFDTTMPKNLFTVPGANKYLFADIRIPLGNVRIKDVSGEFPISKSFESNEIEVKLLL
jgi:hypothetical protein